MGPQEYDFSASLKTQADAQFNNIKYLYIGKNESMTEGFSGCISRVEFDEIIPLKLYFQEDPHGNIRSEPEIIPEDPQSLMRKHWQSSMTPPAPSFWVLSSPSSSS